MTATYNTSANHIDAECRWTTVNGSPQGATRCVMAVTVPTTGVPTRLTTAPKPSTADTTIRKAVGLVLVSDAINHSSATAAVRPIVVRASSASWATASDEAVLITVMVAVRRALRPQ